MCIIIYKRENATLPSFEVLKKCFDTNSDGAGFCYVNNKNMVKMEKGFFDFKDFYKRLLEIQNDKHLLIHMRISTGGQLDKRNCHPYKINSNLYLAHNGVLPKSVAQSNIVLSDSYIYNEILKLYKLKSKDLTNEYFKEILGLMIGKSNKLVFFSNRKFAIINEIQGTWENGVWYSNDGYKINNNRNNLHNDNLNSYFYDKEIGKLL